MSLTKEDLQAIGELIDGKLEPIKTDIAEMKADISGLKTDMAEVKEKVTEINVAVGVVVDWIDEAAPVVEVSFPVRKKPN